MLKPPEWLFNSAEEAVEFDASSIASGRSKQ